MKSDAVAADDEAVVPPPPPEDSLPQAVIAMEIAAKPTITAVTRARCTEISHTNQSVWNLPGRAGPGTRGQARPPKFPMRPILFS
jgi:hypothetical protein